MADDIMDDDIFEQLMKANFKTLTEENTEANTKISSEIVRPNYKWSDICPIEACGLLFTRIMFCIIVLLILAGAIILIMILEKNT